MIWIRKLIIFFSISVNSLFTQVTVELLTNATEGSTSIQENGVLNTYYHDYKNQALYLATDLVLASIGSGSSISEIGIKVNERPGGNNAAQDRIINFRIAFASTSSTTLSTLEPTTVVYGPIDILNSDFTVGQWKIFTLDTPIVWNGTDNLIIEFSTDGDSYKEGGGVYNRQVSNRSRHFRADSNNGPYPFGSGSGASLNYVPSLKITHNGPGIILDPGSITTTEAGGTGTFNVRLNSAPTDDVTIGLSSSDPTEGIPNPTSLTFTSSNYATSQTVTVTGQDDAVDDGNVAYNIETAAATSADPTYNGMDAIDVDVVNNNDDTAGIQANPTTGLTTTEGGGKDAFDVTLATPPTNQVTVLLTSSNTAEGTVPASIQFLTSNWNVPQTVTITGIDDAATDGNQAYQITGTGSSSDGTYHNLSMSTVSVTNSDNDTPGLTVSPITGLTTTEAGGTASFTVKLASQPSQNVGLTLSSSDPTEGLPSTLNALSSELLTFTYLDWNTPQTVTVTGVDDNIDDGDVSYNITGTASSSDNNYNNMNMPNVSTTNSDDDTKGITVNSGGGTLTTTESGDAATFLVVLSSEPSDDVSIGITSSDNSEGTVSASTLTFTNSNWNTAQTVTVTGADDNTVDGDITYTAATASASSNDANYNGIDPDNVSVINIDDDAIGFQTTPASGLTTSEAGATATFTVRLMSQPSASVSSNISSSDETEGTVSPSSVTFTTNNFNTAQTITVTGADDDEWDQDVAYNIVLAAATSSDADYNNFDPNDVSVSNTDDENAAVILTPEVGLNTTEDGGNDKIIAVLNGQPANNVTVNFASSDLTESSVSPASLTFNSVNWNTDQSVDVTGNDDNIVDGNASYQVNATVSSDDSNFNGLVASVSGANADNDAVGITIGSPSGNSTSETGAKVTFKVVLESEPTSNVQIAVLSSDQTEGVASPTILNFTPTDWNQKRTITVSGKDDMLVDPDEAYQVIVWPAVSNDASYNGLDPPDVALTNADNDEAGVLMTPLEGLSTTETGEYDSVSVVLTAEPDADVTVTMSTDDPSEGSVSPLDLTFTASNWSISQKAIVTGVDDELADSDIVYNVVGKASSTDSEFNNLPEVKSSATNINDDPPGIRIDPVGGLVTTEGGGSGKNTTFTVSLLSGPTGDVSFELYSSNVNEGTISVSSLTFTSVNWVTPQTVTISGVDDEIDDGDINFTIITGKSSSTDQDYNDLNIADVSVTNIDDDVTAFYLTDLSDLTTSEVGGTANFKVSLFSKPTAGVTVGLISDDNTEGSPSPGSIVFTDQNWNTTQTVTITGINDDIDDGNADYSIILSSVSNDPTYGVLLDSTVSITNNDDDTAGLSVSGNSGLVTTEAGGDTSVKVVLNSEPTSDVYIVLTSSDSSEGLAHSDSIRFTPKTWSTEQNLTLIGQDDYVDEGDIEYSVIGVPRSNDPKYNSLSIFNLSATNKDNDSAAVNITPITDLVTSEGGFSALFTIGLSSEPLSDVKIAVVSSDETEGKVSPSLLTFSSSAWGVDTVTVTGQNDGIDDGDVEYNILTWAAVSEDGKYSGLDPTDFTLTNLVVLLEVSTTEIDFSKVRLDSSKTLSFTVSATGPDTLKASSLDFTNKDFSSPDGSLKIPPSSIHTLNVIFQPSDLGIYLDTLELPFNLPLRKNPKIILRGEGVKPTIAASATDLDFGMILLGEPQMISFDIVNSGTDILTVDSLVTDSTNFIATLSEAVSIVPGDTLRARVIFRPETGGEISDTLIIYSNDPDRLQIPIPMKGTGITYPDPLYDLNSIGLTTILGEDVFIEQIIVNDGDYSMEFSTYVDDSSSAWLSVSPDSGTVLGHDTLSVTISVNNTEVLGEGGRNGKFFITTNSGQNLMDKTDSIFVDLKILSASHDILSSSSEVSAGDSDIITFTDDQGKPLNLSLDFSSGDGGPISVIYYPTAPLIDSGTVVHDPDSLVEKPIFGNIYWEIVSDLSKTDTLDLIFGLNELIGIQEFDKLRIGRRLENSGKRIAWDLVPVNQTVVNVSNRSIMAIDQNNLSQWTIISDSSDNTFIDNLSPVVTSFTFSPSSPQSGEEVKLNLSLADESAIENAKLYYLVGGDSEFLFLNMESVGMNNYEATIIPINVSVKGLAFFATATDVAGYSTVSDTFSPAINFPKDILNTRVIGSAYKMGIPKSKWRLLSVPSKLDDSSTESIFSDALKGKTSKKTWRVMEPSGIEWIDAPSVEPGKGYWIYQQVKKQATIKTGPGETSDFKGAVLELAPGWNTIGSPYAFPVNIKVDDGFYGPISYGIADYEGWTDVETQLKPWAGYAIYNRADFSRPFNIKPIGSSARLARSLDDSTGWELKLMAEGKNYADMTTAIGRKKGGAEGSDTFDNPEPPLLEDYISVSMFRPDWDQNLTKFTSDIRSIEIRDGVWDVNIDVKGEEGPISLYFDLSGFFSEQDELILLDMSTRKQLDIIENNSIQIIDYSEEISYKLKIFAGSPEFVASAIAEALSLLPDKFSLRQNYPNPFNPSTTIEFTLPHPENVSLIIYNLMGQEVKTLKRGMVDTGKHTIRWHGKDNFGRMVSSGVYFVRFRSDQFSASHKMVLMK